MTQSVKPEDYAAPESAARVHVPELERHAINQMPKSGKGTLRLLRYVGTDLYQWWRTPENMPVGTCFDEAETEPFVIRPRSAPAVSVGECSCPTCGCWYAAEDIDRMVRDLDVAMNGDGAAAQAKLCDIFDQLMNLAALSSAGSGEPVAWRVEAYGIVSFHDDYGEALAQTEGAIDPLVDPLYASPTLEGVREKVADIVERILFQRVVQNRLDGFTKEAAAEIADAMLSALKES